MFEAFYINIKGSSKRRLFMEKQFQALGVKYTRIEAVTLDADSEYARYPKDLYNQRNGKSALVLSWIRALETAVQGSPGHVLIAEDDTQFNKRTFLHELRETLAVLPESWHGLHLGTDGIVHTKRTNQRFQGRPWPKYIKWNPGEPLYPGGPGALLIKRNHIHTLLDRILQWCRHRKWEGMDVIQGYIYTEHEDMNIFVADRPQLCVHNRRLLGDRLEMSKFKWYLKYSKDILFLKKKFKQ